MMGLDGRETGADVPLWPRYPHAMSDALFQHFHQRQEKVLGAGLGIWLDVGG